MNEESSAPHDALTVPVEEEPALTVPLLAAPARPMLLWLLAVLPSLLLVFVTGLGYLLPGRPGLRRRIVSSALGQLPVIGREITSHSLRGNAPALAVGIAVSVWTGTGVVLAAQRALQRIWDVPDSERFGFVQARLRALGLLVVVGTVLVAVAVLSGAGSGAKSRS